MFNLLKKDTKEIQDLKEYSVFPDGDISKIRRNVQILFIDDDKLEIIDKLNCFEYNITYKKDLDSINDVCVYDIVLCDVRGIGQAFSSEYEGAFLIREIKAHYPNKIIIAYTGSTYDASYNVYLKNADRILTKGKKTEDWVETLDEVIKLAIDPIYQWKKTRTKLLDNDVRISLVSELESNYVQAIKDKNFTSFEDLMNNIKDQKNNDKVYAILKDLLSSILVKLVKEVL